MLHLNTVRDKSFQEALGQIVEGSLGAWGELGVRPTLPMIAIGTHTVTTSINLHVIQNANTNIYTLIATLLCIKSLKYLLTENEF